jgi:sigma-B regulation protein RsbU (phosphoserine phosphatase)
MQLAPGESIFLYTDGVTEAMSAEERLFGEKRLKQLLMEAVGLPPKETVARVLGAVAEHTAGATQSDDITALCVRWSGR